MRDLRDPFIVGVKLLALRRARPDISASELADLNGLVVSDWKGDGFMSNDPAEHHSKTPQDSPLEGDGGA